MFRYPPADAEHIRRIRAIEGDFSHSRAEQFFIWFFVLICTCTGAFVIGTAVYLRTTMDLYRPVWPLVMVGLALIAIGLFIFIRRAGVIYRFRSGTIMEISSSGKVRWEESLAGLETYVETRNYRSISTLKLKWGSHSRTIELMQSLEKALG